MNTEDKSPFKPEIVLSQITQLNSLLELQIAHKKEIFTDLSQLVGQLYNTQNLLKQNRTTEALLQIEQLVNYGELMTRKF